MTLIYPDLSHYSWDRHGGQPDWAALKAAGYRVVVIRATYGDPAGYNPTTRHFREMAAAAKAAGLFVGGYHNLVHGDDASIARQVAYFKAELDAVGADWAMLDVEPYDALVTNGLWPRLDDAVRFERAFNAADPKRRLVIYLPRWFWQRPASQAGLGQAPLAVLQGPLVSSNYPASTIEDTVQRYQAVGGDSGPGWAAYGGKTPAVWQFSSSVTLPGVSDTEDINAFKGSFDEFVARVTKAPSPALQHDPAAHVAPPWPLPDNEYFGDINGPDASHGGWYVDEQPWVRLLQQRLIVLGFVPGVTDPDSSWADGIFGPATIEAAMRFEAARKLPVDGQITKYDWSRLWADPADLPDEPEPPASLVPPFVVPNGVPYANVTEALYWFWLQFKKHEPEVLLGGIYANKWGFHNRGDQVADYGQGDSRTDYSIRDAINRSGYWRTKASAIDLTFPSAQRGNYSKIAKYSKRLYDSARDSKDPRLGMVMCEFFGQIDNDTAVEGWNEYRESNTTSDSSHLWHIHISIYRSKVHDFWAMWALLTVLMGWTVDQWRASIGLGPAPAPAPSPKPKPAPKASDYDPRKHTAPPWPLPSTHYFGDINGPEASHGGFYASEQPWVKLVQQRLIVLGHVPGVTNYKSSWADGIFGPASVEAVKRFEKARKLTVNGKLTMADWAVLWSKPPVAPAPPKPAPLPVYTLGSRLLKRGMRGTDVQALQKLLGITADGEFGPITEAHVVKLQRARYLDVDGIVGPDTLASIRTGLGKRTLKRGNTGGDVRELQRRVRTTADGIFGPATEKAVKAFQGANGLAKDGIAGPLTLRKLWQRT